MTVNTLVCHRKFKNLGIGCIAKELKSSYRVNFGTDDVKTVKKDLLEEVDTSHCKTVPLSDYCARIMMTKRLENFNDCILGNEVKHFVGTGWVTTGVVTEQDLKTLKRVI